MMKWLMSGRDRGIRVLAAGCLSAGMLAGCGPGGPTTDPSVSANEAPQVAAAQGAGSGGKIAPGGEKSLSKSTEKPTDRPNPVESAEEKKIKAIESKKSEALPLPDEIAKDLGSPYPNARLHALDYWEKSGTKAPLDPLLEAMDDDDDEVRGKAAKIAEKHWGIKSEEE